VVSISQTTRLISPKMPNSALLDSDCVEIPGLLENTVTTEEVVGVQEYVKFLEEKRETVSEDCKKCDEKYAY